MRLGPPATETAAWAATGRRPRKLAIVALWRAGLADARVAAERLGDDYQVVFAQLGHVPAMHGNVVYALARRGVQVVYVPRKFESSEEDSPELRAFIGEVLRTREATRVEDATAEPPPIDKAAAAAMQDRVRSQEVPSEAAIEALAREFYEANEFDLPATQPKKRPSPRK